jgi:nucleotide-binding universal stress UspA family protein
MSRIVVGIDGSADLLAEFAQRAQAQLCDCLSKVLPDPPPVVVSRIVAQGSPAAVLVDRARGADLLVLGQRGRERLSGLLGTVAQRSAEHAPCPVVLVPAGYASSNSTAGDYGDLPKL